MELVKIFKKAMVDKGITGNPELALLSGVSYDITLRLMKGSKLIKLIDVESIATSLDLEIKFVTKGDK